MLLRTGRTGNNSRGNSKVSAKANSKVRVSRVKLRAAAVNRAAEAAAVAAG